jgi:HD-like signal output (HDOD) protein
MKKINKIRKLPSLPQIYTQLMDAIAAERSFKKIAAIIEQDVSISTKLLQLANSSLYGFGYTTSLPRALMIVGVQTLRDIVLTFSITNQLSWTEDQREQLRIISMHSLIVSRYTSEIFSLMFKIPLPVEFSSVGITHDIGKIIQLQYFFEEYEEISTRMKRESEKSYHDIEMEIGLESKSHSELGAYFLRNWNLPEANCQVAQFHHLPEEASNQYKSLMKAINLTNYFANFHYDNRNSNYWDIEDFHYNHLLSPKALTEIGNRMRTDMKNQFTF